MHFDVVTIFPELVSGFVGQGLLGRAIDAGLIGVDVHDMRSHGLGRHRQVDDAVFGGGPGMVLMPEVVAAAIDEADGGRLDRRRVVLTPSGRRLDQSMLDDFSQREAMTLLCGRYEGIDQRVLDAYGCEPISIGDYVIAGGELAALVVIEGVARLVPGVMGNPESAVEESFRAGLLEGPTYTRPSNWRGRRVPEALLSGDHRRIADWRRQAGVDRTRRVRSDLYRIAIASGIVEESKSDHGLG